MKAKWIIAIVVLVTAQFSCSLDQVERPELFYKIFMDLDGYATDVASCSDGGFMICGQYDTIQFEEEAVWVIKTDAYGELEWKVEIETDYWHDPRNLTKLNSGNYMLCSPLAPEVVILNEAGAVLHRVTHNWADEVYTVPVVGDDGLIYLSYETIGEAFIIAMDEQGNEVNRYVYQDEDFGYYLWSLRLIEVVDGVALVTGNLGDTSSTAGNYFRAFLTNIDLDNGPEPLMILSKDEDEDPDDRQEYALLADGNPVLIDREPQGIQHRKYRDLTTVIYANKRDRDNFDLLWSKKIEYLDQPILIDAITPTKDGGVLMVMDTEVFKDEWQILIVKLDKDGQVVYEDLNDELIDPGVYSVRELENGSIVIVGFAGPYGSGQSKTHAKAMMIQLGADGQF